MSEHQQTTAVYCRACGKAYQPASPGRWVHVCPQTAKINRISLGAEGAEADLADAMEAVKREAAEQGRAIFLTWQEQNYLNNLLALISQRYQPLVEEVFYLRRRDDPVTKHDLFESIAEKVAAAVRPEGHREQADE